MNIYVGNLSFRTTEEELRKTFEAFGEISSVKIIMDPHTGKSRGFGFVDMPNRNEALAAIAGVNGKDLGGFALRVSEAKPREVRGGDQRQGGRSSSGGRGSGGRERRRW